MCVCVCVHTYDEWSCAPRKFRAEQLFKRTFISSPEINKKILKRHALKMASISEI